MARGCSRDMSLVCFGPLESHSLSGGVWGVLLRRRHGVWGVLLRPSHEELPCSGNIATRNLPTEWHLIGADISRESVAQDRQFPARLFVVAAAEKLPFADCTFDRVFLGVALPYMNIPGALAEIRRVLIADGKLRASLHDFRFTLDKIRKAFPKLLATLSRFRAFFNGIVFHLTGRSLGESFQTKRGITAALRRESFSSPRFSHAGKRWIVEAEAFSAETTNRVFKRESPAAAQSR